MAEELTRWTIRVALLAYVARVALGIWSREGLGSQRLSVKAGLEQSGAIPASMQTSGARTERAARWLWTIGCALLLVHVGCAFQFYHDWSQAAALAQTARETTKTIGLNWGGGIYFNYLLMLLWTADVLWWWLRPASYHSRPRAVGIALNAYFAFMAFNATVVFETGATRYVGLAVTIALVLLLVYRSRVGRTK